MTNPVVPPPTSWRARGRPGLHPTSRTPATPLNLYQRVERYIPFDGRVRPLTPRQERRVRHKANRAKLRAELAKGTTA